MHFRSLAFLVTLLLSGHGFGQHVRIKGVTSSNPRLPAKLETIKTGEQYVVSVQPSDTVQKESAEISVLTDFPADAPRTYILQARVK